MKTNPTPPEAAAGAMIPPIWRAHDELEELLTITRRLAGTTAEVLADPRIAHAYEQIWQAHDLIERATLELHAILPPGKLDALMKKAA